MTWEELGHIVGLYKSRGFLIPILIFFLVLFILVELAPYILAFLIFLLAFLIFLLYLKLIILIASKDPEKKKKKPIAISILVVLTVVLTAGIIIFMESKYSSIFHLIKEVDNMITNVYHDDYEKIINLNEGNIRLLAKARSEVIFGILGKKIDNRLDQIARQTQYIYYESALKNFNNQNWEKALSLFGKVSVLCDCYKDAQDKIKIANIERRKEEIEKQRNEGKLIEGTVFLNGKPAKGIDLKLCGGFEGFFTFKCKELERNSKSGSEGRYYFLNVPSGRYTLLYKTEEYGSWTKEKEITKKENFSLEIPPLNITNESEL